MSGKEAVSSMAQKMNADAEVMSAPLPSDGRLLLACERTSRNFSRTGGKSNCFINSIARAAYFMTCKVSMPPRSLKNQPQLVYIKSAMR